MHCVCIDKQQIQIMLVFRSPFGGPVKKIGLKTPNTYESIFTVDSLDIERLQHVYIYITSHANPSGQRKSLSTFVGLSTAIS
jgi:hypothetical protein